ncbi:hypothetical protein Dimus_017161 [Dionaea muscipula]
MKKWVRGGAVGRGTFGAVNLALPTTSSSSSNPPLMVVKSCEDSKSETLKNEKQVLSQLPDCPYIVRFLGDDLSVESNGQKVYNLLFEYAPKGNLADQLKSSCSVGGGFSDAQVRAYTRMLLRGLCSIHENGFVHCDIKLQNILLFEDGAAKIADFGLARRAKQEKNSDGFVLRGTPLYMSPEVVNGGEAESPADIWSLGCAVVEMITGKPAWRCSPGCDVSALLYRIGTGGETPEIPANLCTEGRDFLRKCFSRDPNERWTARMLLEHPFVSWSNDDESGSDRERDDCDGRPWTSPRCPLDFPDWASSEGWSPEYSSSKSGLRVESQGGDELTLSSPWCLSSVSGRIQGLVCDHVPDWCDSDEWIRVR